MGKKKKHKKKNCRRGPSSMYNKERNRIISSHLKAYIDGIDNLFILEGTSEKDIKKSRKIILEACEALDNNRPEDVYNIERYCEVHEDLDDF